MDMSLYSPSSRALDRLREVRFVAVVGPTAVGKTTLIREAMQRNSSLHLVLNNTSRTPRPDEQEWVDYRFETRDAMEQRIEHGEYVQVAPSVFGDLYATAADDYSTEGVAVLPVLADALPQFRALPFKEMRCIYVLPPDWETWQARIAKHNFAPDKLAARLREAQRSLTVAKQDSELEFIISRSIESATNDFMRLALAQPYTETLQADQELAVGIIASLLARLDRVL